MSLGQRCVCFGITNSVSLLLKARVWDRVWSYRFIITLCFADWMFQPKISHLLRSRSKKRVCDCVPCLPVRLMYQHVFDVLCVALFPRIQAGTRRTKKKKESFHNLRVADYPAGCLTIFGFQEVLEFLQEEIWACRWHHHAAASHSFPVADNLLRQPQTRLHADTFRWIRLNISASENVRSDERLDGSALVVILTP